MSKKIPLFKTYKDKSDLEAVSKVIKRGTYWAAGPEIDEFEKKIADYIGTKYCAVFNSGTSASHAMLLAHGIKDGEVIVPSFTFVSTANCVVMAGAKPVFAEIEEETLGLDYEDVKKRINDKTRAVMIVHYAGCPARDTLKIKELCKDKGILFFEDAAESMGASIDGKMTGSIGDGAMLSFCQNKIISTGEGGAVLTDSKVVYEKLKVIRSHGRTDEDYFASTQDPDYQELGYGYRMPTMCAALGISQLNKISKLISMRRECAEKYNELNLSIKAPEKFDHVYQIYTILLKDEITRDKLAEFLNENEISCKIYFAPAHLKQYYNTFGWKEGDLPLTERISKRVLSIPIYPGISKDEIKLIISKIKEFGVG